MVKLYIQFLNKVLPKMNNTSYVGYLIPTFLCIIAALDFANDGKIDKTIIGALLVIGLVGLGYKIDNFIGNINTGLDMNNSEARTSTDKSEEKDK